MAERKSWSGIDRRHREVAALDARTMADVAVVGSLAIRIPRTLDESTVDRTQPFIELRSSARSSKMKNSFSGPKNAVSAIPVDFRYASARRASERGQRGGRPGCIVAGSTTSQRSIDRGFLEKRVRDSHPPGIQHRRRVFRFLMPFHPAIEEPSNILPSMKKSSSTTRAGIVTCCSLPRVSVNRRSRIPPLFP